MSTKDVKLGAIDGSGDGAKALQLAVKSKFLQRQQKGGEVSASMPAVHAQDIGESHCRCEGRSAMTALFREYFAPLFSWLASQRSYDGCVSTFVTDMRH